MGENTKIEWTDAVWNPVTGCDPVSAGCNNCYARRMATRLAGRYGYPKRHPFDVTVHPERLAEPLHWRKPRRVFVCSMGCESGPRRRPCNLDWVRSIRDQCQASGVPLFVKQLDIGGKVVKELDQFPEDFRIREVPR